MAINKPRATGPTYQCLVPVHATSEKRLINLAKKVNHVTKAASTRY